MKVIILAGGYGTRMGTISEVIPKPMIRVGTMPILWHVMKIYSSQGFNNFVLALGYKGNMIKEFFFNYKLHNDFTVNTQSGEVEYHNSSNEDWNVTCVDTGLNTLKGGRIKRVEKYLDDDINMLTYGDGVADIDIHKLLEFHKSHNKILTITGVKPPSRFGELKHQNDTVLSFEEKPQASEGLINGGFMVFDKKLLSHLTEDEECDFEHGPVEKIARLGEVMVYKHDGNFECADTVREINHLNKIWNENRAFWKKW
jgi:glucose-1-phosphate cytidylyltransferase